jgi:superkiller protein 3
MSFIKTYLKAARDHIGKKDYLTAKKEANKVLDFEPDNYNALAAICLPFSSR